MNSSAKKIIAVTTTILIMGVAYYGSYLPMKKSTMFIDAMSNSGGVRSVGDFEKLLSQPLDYPSPIGQAELVRNAANTISGIVRANSEIKVIDELMRYIESYYGPIVARGKGMSFGQDVYLLGALNETAYLKTGNPRYLQAAETYFRKEQEIGPRRPQGLYGLLDIYRFEGKAGEFRKVAEQVLSQWPDEQTKNLIEQIIKQASFVTSTKK